MDGSDGVQELVRRCMLFVKIGPNPCVIYVLKDWGNYWSMDSSGILVSGV